MPGGPIRFRTVWNQVFHASPQRQKTKQDIIITITPTPTTTIIIIIIIITIITIITPHLRLLQCGG
jgi:hypothetical protein